MRGEGWIRKDTEGSAWLRKLGKGKGRWVWVVLAHSADLTILFPAAGLIWLFGTDDWKSRAWKAGLALIIGTFLTGLLKLFFRRRRPDGRWGALDRLVDPHSFPSGHANRVAILAVFAGMHGTPILAAGVAIWALAVGLSRIILGMHYISDVLAGLFFGAAVAVFF
ncbi:MAG: phosphatase PAP2 family protein [Candidatus Aminicenantales bacterium]